MALDWLQEKICKHHLADFCQRDPKNLGSRRLTRDDMRWALAVVRTHTLRCRKVTTGQTFLALVPFAEHLR